MEPQMELLTALLMVTLIERRTAPLMARQTASWTELLSEPLMARQSVRQTVLLMALLMALLTGRWWASSLAWRMAQPTALLQA